MGDAAGELADGLHLLRLAQGFFHQPDALLLVEALGDVVGELIGADALAVGIEQRAELQFVVALQRCLADRDDLVEGFAVKGALPLRGQPFADLRATVQAERRTPPTAGGTPKTCSKRSAPEPLTASQRKSKSSTWIIALAASTTLARMRLAARAACTRSSRVSLSCRRAISARLRAVMSWNSTATWRRLAGSMRKAASPGSARWPPVPARSGWLRRCAARAHSGRARPEPRRRPCRAASGPPHWVYRHGPHRPDCLDVDVVAQGAVGPVEEFDDAEALVHGVEQELVAFAGQGRAVFRRHGAGIELLAQLLIALLQLGKARQQGRMSATGTAGSARRDETTASPQRPALDGLGRKSAGASQIL